MGGFAFAPARTPMEGNWAASEGQSDYFATQACARRIWAADAGVNAGFRASATPEMKKQCDAVWTAAPEQNLCYRVLAAVESMSLTMANILKKQPPQFETPDQSAAEKNIPGHPAVQCRMDTSLQGAICPALFDFSVIPGKKTAGGPFAIEAEKEAALHSCTQLSGYSIGLRPACWFKARM